LETGSRRTYPGTQLETADTAKGSLRGTTPVLDPTTLGRAPEDLVVYRAVAWRERDRTDIERLLVRYAGRIDLGRVRSLLREFADALDEPEPVAAFDALISAPRTRAQKIEIGPSGNGSSIATRAG
jgi:hypothetical protein